ncbi:hypothetical protein ASPBRDRAFT_47893 [Aspergillus brasiliensis CBS 101740]|uniref:Uncharacterized protein n=1 Tax=Aspergillus brasiliensis (strain CBS 101740 / IMI 381727 / IBT 21946) TaxID=767769 RepID=A0A1L9U6P3_ASPBC|nr:hypothetical protein ASPBRDRAFT_47893 [Aspergillus brasiliensis CBS 101740]
MDEYYLADSCSRVRATVIRLTTVSVTYYYISLSSQPLIVAVAVTVAVAVANYYGGSRW